MLKIILGFVADVDHTVAVSTLPVLMMVGLIPVPVPVRVRVTEQPRR